MTMHDDHLPDEERARARHAIGRARLIARLEAEADRMNRWWLRPFSSPWVAAAAVVAVAIGAALLPLRGTIARPGAAAIEAGSLPVAALTPGATIEIDVRDVCDETPRPPQEIGAAVRRAVLRSYGMESVPADQYELDYLITPQLGGAPDARNLWPQRYQARVWNAGVKDQLEDLLPRLVCEGRVDLRTAQRDIAADWVSAYRKYFGTASPLRPPAPLVSLWVGPRPGSVRVGSRIDYHSQFIWWTSALTR
jgi:hypothetical protein